MRQLTLLKSICTNTKLARLVTKIPRSSSDEETQDSGESAVVSPAARRARTRTRTRTRTCPFARSLARPRPFSCRRRRSCNNDGEETRCRGRSPRRSDGRTDGLNTEQLSSPSPEYEKWPLCRPPPLGRQVLQYIDRSLLSACLARKVGNFQSGYC